MKKIAFFASLLTVLAGMASCQKNIGASDGQQPSGKFRQVTVYAVSSQTKTSVSGGVLTWTSSDKLNIVPQSGSVAAAALDLKSGAGTAIGTFKGQVDESVTDDTALYAWCGGSWTYNAGTFTVDMSASQTYVANGLAENAFPSIGTGSITDGITLSNPMGVLKVIVKGATTDLVKSITVTSAANNLAGTFTVDKSGYAVSGGSSKTVTLNIASPYVALSSAGVNFYVVVPSAAYAAKDLTITVTKSDDTSFSNNVADAVTVTANHASSVNVEEEKGPEIVDLGLSIKWASCNIGATKPEEAGIFFGYGDVKGQTWNGTSWSGGGFSPAIYYELDANNNLKPEYDAAHVKCGGSWRMPTQSECQELITNCTATYIADYNGTGVSGNLFTSNKTGYQDKSIFVPQVGFGSENNYYSTNVWGQYWLSTFYQNGQAYVFCSLTNGAPNVLEGNISPFGRTIRPVTE